MKTFYYSILFVSFILVTGSCNNGNKKENGSNTYLATAPVIAQKSIHYGEELITAEPPKDKRQLIIPLSSILSSFEIVYLEDSEEALTAPDGITISENYIGIASFQANAYKLYDRKGNYIATLAKPGQGPDEYFINIYDSYIDEEKQLVYLLAFRADKILVFDLQGNPQQHIPLAYITHKGKFIIDNVNEKLLMMAMPFEENPSAIWEQDFTGNIIREIPTGHFLISPSDYSNEVESHFSTDNIDYSIFYWGMRNDSVYHYQSDKNELKPVFTMDFKDQTMYHSYTELPGHYLVWIYPHAAGMTIPRYPKILIDKKTLKGSYVDFKFDMLGNIDGPNKMLFDRGYFITDIDSDELKEQLRKALQKPENIPSGILQKMKEVYNHLGEDDNSIVFIGKLKTE